MVSGYVKALRSRSRHAGHIQSRVHWYAFARDFWCAELWYIARDLFHKMFLYNTHPPTNKIHKYQHHTRPPFSANPSRSDLGNRANIDPPRESEYERKADKFRPCILGSRSWQKKDRGWNWKGGDDGWRSILRVKRQLKIGGANTPYAGFLMIEFS